MARRGILNGVIMQLIRYTYRYVQGISEPPFLSIQGSKYFILQMI